MWVLSCSIEINPRALFAIGPLESSDVRFHAQDYVDLVEAFEQRHAALGRGFERKRAAIGSAHFAALEIDGDERLCCALQRIAERCAIRSVQRDGKKAILIRVLAEDVREARRDQQRMPNRMSAHTARSRELPQ